MFANNLPLQINLQQIVVTFNRNLENRPRTSCKMNSIFVVNSSSANEQSTMPTLCMLILVRYYIVHPAACSKKGPTEQNHYRAFTYSSTVWTNICIALVQCDNLSKLAVCIVDYKLMIPFCRFSTNACLPFRTKTKDIQFVFELARTFEEDTLTFQLLISKSESNIEGLFSVAEELFIALIASCKIN